MLSHHLTENYSQMMTKLFQPISEDEIRVAIAQLRDVKTPGDDGISAELLKLGGGETVCWLTSLFNFIWSSESILSDWLNHFTVPLYKKGSHSSCDNYRGIAFLSIPSKIFACVTLSRIKTRAETLLHENQYGFRKAGCAPTNSFLLGCSNVLYTSIL